MYGVSISWRNNCEHTGTRKCIYIYSSQTFWSRTRWNLKPDTSPKPPPPQCCVLNRQSRHRSFILLGNESVTYGRPRQGNLCCWRCYMTYSPTSLGWLMQTSSTTRKDNNERLGERRHLVVYTCLRISEGAGDKTSTYTSSIYHLRVPLSTVVIRSAIRTDTTDAAHCL